MQPPPAEHPKLAHRRWIRVAAWRPEIRGIHDVATFVADGEELPPLLTDGTRWRSLVVDRALPAILTGACCA